MTANVYATITSRNITEANNDEVFYNSFTPFCNLSRSAFAGFGQTYTYNNLSLALAVKPVSAERINTIQNYSSLYFGFPPDEDGGSSTVYGANPPINCSVFAPYAVRYDTSRQWCEGT